MIFFLIKIFKRKTKNIIDMSLPKASNAEEAKYVYTPRDACSVSAPVSGDMLLVLGVGSSAVN